MYLRWITLFIAYIIKLNIALEVAVVNKIECNRKTKAGDRIYVRYTGSVDSSSITGVPGKIFDTNVNKPDPLEFYLGKGTVIKGWDLGLLDMCVGEKRILIIPPDQAYGSRGFGKNIPRGFIF
jgi:FK506-binding protein 2